MSTADAPAPAPTAADPDLIAAIDQRRLGQDPGLLRVQGAVLAARLIARLASQARRELTLLSPDLEPALYDQAPFLAALRRLALERIAHLPVRVLLIDPEPAIHRGHRLIELARRLSSAIQMRVLPAELADQCDALLLADDQGYCLRRRSVPNLSLADLAAPAEVARQRRRFDALWEQSTENPGLRRLHL